MAVRLMNRDPAPAPALAISSHLGPGRQVEQGLVGLLEAQRPSSDRWQQLQNVAAHKPLTVGDHLGNFQHTSSSW